MGRVIRAFFDFEENLQAGDYLELDKDESLHLSKVLRIGVGDNVEVLNGKGYILITQCTEVILRQVNLEVISVDFSPKLVPQISVGIAMTKKSKWEEVIRPLTELGVYRITPLFTQRTEGKGSDFKYQSKIVKWRKLAIEGCKQSGNPWIPVFENPQSIEKVLVKTGEKDELWLGSLRATATRLQPSFDLKALSILIGPEGGWSEEEEDTAIQLGAKPFSLSPYTLRTQNGAVSALAVARSQYLG